MTLGDLLILEPGLKPSDHPDGVPETSELPAARTISWAVTARTTPPHLPNLRGGEVIIIPARVTREVGDDLPALLREAAYHHVSGVIFADSDRHAHETYPQSLGVPTLWWTGELTGDTETAINRMLTECRGNLYRIGTELERQIADAAASNSGVETLAQIVFRASGLSLIMRDALGRRLTSSGTVGDDASDPTCAVNDPELTRTFPSGARLALEPARADQRILARFLIDRVAAAAISALQRDDAARPRGSRRAEATRALLAGETGNPSEQRLAALGLGLDPDAVFFVAICTNATESEIARGLGVLGTSHSAGGTKEQRFVLVETKGRPAADSLASRVLEVKKHWQQVHGRNGSTLALSAPAFGVARISAAAREAEFVASLQAQEQFPRRAASFESLDDVGAMRLLYQLRDSSELRQFVSEALGKLEHRDRRGTLRATLSAFLESGGSQVDASHKLGIHRNTLAYRLRRIGELVGRDVGDPQSWLTLHLALRASEMLEHYAGDP